MSNQQLDGLVKMINQIAANNSHHDSDDLAAQAIATHLDKFWAPSMKRALADYARSDGETLSPLSKLAVTKLHL